MFSIFSVAIFVTPLPHSHRNLETFEFEIAMSKFPRMFDEDSISQIWGSCDNCNGEEGDKNRGQKNQTAVFDFWTQFLSPIQGSVMIAMGMGGVVGWVTKIATEKIKPRFRFFWLWFLSPKFPYQQFWSFENKILKTVWRRRNIVNLRILQLRWGKVGWRRSRLKKSEMWVRFFRPRFSSPNFPHRNLRTLEFVILHLRPTSLKICFQFFWSQFSSSNLPPLQSQGPRIRDIASSSEIFENLKFSKMFDEDAILRIRRSCDWDVWEEGVDDKNYDQKN